MLQLSANISPGNATYKTVVWSIQNITGQATVNSSGLVTAINNGTVTVTATSTDGSGVSGFLTITITNQNAQTGLNDEPPNDFFVTVTPTKINISMNESSPNRQIDLYNILGSRVMHKQILEMNESVDVTALFPGIYILVISGMGEVRKMKVFKP
jgi:hypothetical protein